MSMNKIFLEGFLGKDVELKTTGGGKAYGKFSMATTDTWKDANGAKQSKTEWHECTAWGKTGENIAKFFHKGSEILIEGKLKYTIGKKNVNGTEIEIKYPNIEVIAFYFIGKVGDNNGSRNSSPEPEPPGYDNSSDNNGGSGGGSEEDIPF